MDGIAVELGTSVYVRLRRLLDANLPAGATWRLCLDQGLISPLMLIVAVAGVGVVCQVCSNAAVNAARHRPYQVLDVVL